MSIKLTDTLPVTTIFPQLESALAEKDVLLVAPPGAGKSTCLPLQLLTLPIFANHKIIMLQPRRIAVRAIARYLAQQLNEPVGHTIGYRIRGESKVSKSTRLEIVTEGVLTRRLQHQPELEDVGLVIFDEFHERSVHADLSLALCLEVQQNLRDDLRLLVMSATLNIEALQQFMPEARLLECNGRAYPVTMHYAPNAKHQTLSAKMANLIMAATSSHAGSILAFFPATRDIKQCEQALSAQLPADIDIYCLFGDLNKQQQMAAVSPSVEGRRKIVLATNIAETSLTIDGIEVVIDSGLEKVARFDLNRGVTQLVTQRISQASATQRAGRAGRTASGHCYRMWDKEQHSRLPKQSTPEILYTDCMPLLFECACWGTSVTQLALIDQPSDAQIQRAEASLKALQAIDEKSKITAHGRALQQFGSHPSLANMLSHVKNMGANHRSMAAAIVALLEQKDPFPQLSTACLQERLQLLQQQRHHPLWKMIEHWHQRIGCGYQPWPIQDASVLLALVHPDWLAKQRGQGRYLLVNGSGAKLDDPQEPLAKAEWLAIGHLLTTNQQQSDIPIKLAAKLNEDAVRAHFSHLIEEHTLCLWDNQNQKILAESRRCLGQIVLSVDKLSQPDEAHCQQLWLQQLNKMGVMQLPFSDTALQLIYRVRLAARIYSHEPWPDFSEQGLQSAMSQWLLPYLIGVYSLSQLQKLDFEAMLKSCLDWSLQQQLSTLLPTHITVPSGSRVPLQYSVDGSVKLSVRMQALYGLSDTPTVAQGKLAVQLELLSPAQRPLQQTQDLAGFWAGSYKEIQKEMKGRYPKHFWPDDPANAQATNKTKKHM